MSTECVYNPNSKRLIKVGSRLYKTLVRDAIIVDGKFQDEPDWHRESEVRSGEIPVSESESEISEDESMRFELRAEPACGAVRCAHVPTLSEDEISQDESSQDESRRFVPTLSQDFML